MILKRLLIGLLVTVAVSLAGYAYIYKTQADKKATMRQACIQKYEATPEINVITDINGFCECSIKVRDQKTPEAIIAGGRACMDQYGKENLLKMCEDMNAEMKQEMPGTKGLNCGCFYDKLTSMFGAEMNERKGVDNMTKRQRDETVAKAFIACRN